MTTQGKHIKPPIKKVDVALYAMSILIGVGIAFHGQMVPDAPRNSVEEVNVNQLMAKLDIATNQVMEWKSFDMIR